MAGRGVRTADADLIFSFARDPAKAGIQLVALALKLVIPAKAGIHFDLRFSFLP
jgi:hypothetical protein